MSEAFFRGVEQIRYEGPETENPLAFRYYDKDRIVLGKRLEDQLRVAVCYWHTFAWHGNDVFGGPTFDRPWLQSGDPMVRAEQKLQVAFEFFEKLGQPFFTFHDRDVAPEGSNLKESHANLDRILEKMQGEMARTGKKLLWGTANLFSHPRYMSGAATNPDPEVFAYGAAQVRKILDATHRLGGENYVLWGGREGYETLLNTDMKAETEQLGRFLSLVAEHKHKIGFKGLLLLEPKPKEPTSHQYDFDTATVYAFLQKFGLEKEYKVNIENNHATLAGHSFQHEVAYAAANDILGSIDINRGDSLLGWDTDQFPNDYRECAQAWTIILKNKKGLGSGGLNYDAKVRRDSHDVEDMFYAHICGIDTWARGLRIAEKIIKDGKMDAFVDERYASYDSGIGRNIERGSATLESLQKYIVAKGEVDPTPSARQEYLENLLNKYC